MFQKKEKLSHIKFNLINEKKNPIKTDENWRKLNILRIVEIFTTVHTRSAFNLVGHDVL
jgi:hypothetical protein